MQPITKIEEPKVLINPPPVPQVCQHLTTRLFASTIQPFLNLLALAAGGVLVSSFAAINFTMTAFTAVHVVFYRLIFSPPFNPLDPAFKNVILAKFKNQVPQLQQRIDGLNQKFKLRQKVEEEMKDLEQLIHEMRIPRSKLQSYLTILQVRKTHLPIEADIQEALNLYHDLNDQVKSFFKSEGKGILELFQKDFDCLTKGNFPPEIAKGLISIWKGINGAMCYYKNELGDSSQILFDQLKAQMDFFEETQTIEARPLKLRNIGNSCYLDSVLQALVCIDRVRQELKCPIPLDNEKKEEVNKKTAIQNELLKFLQGQKMSPGGIGMSYVLSRFDEPSLLALRKEIFASGLHPALKGMNEIDDQHDAADLLTLMIDHLLPSCKFKLQKTFLTENLPALEFFGPVDSETSLGLTPFEQDEEEVLTLDMLIKKEMEMQLNEEEKTFHPQEGVHPISGEKATELGNDPVKVQEYCHKVSFKELPQVLTIRIKPYGWTEEKGPHKLNIPVVLDSEMIDLSEYCATPQEAKYKIKSYVVHKGKFLNHGHYVAYVEMDGKYFYCDDTASNPYEEISKEEFFSNTDAYLLFFERVTE